MHTKKDVRYTYGQIVAVYRKHNFTPSINGHFVVTAGAFF